MGGKPTRRVGVLRLPPMESRPPTPTLEGEFEGALPPSCERRRELAKPSRQAGAEPPRGGGVGKGEARAAAEWLRSAPQGAGEVGITFT